MTTGRVLKQRKVQPTVSGVLMQLLPAVLVCGLFAAVGVMHVTSRVLVVDAGYSLSKLEAESRDLQRANDSLKVELATLQSPGRLERLAREKLQMAPPSSGSIITLREGPERLARATRTPPSVASASTAVASADVRGEGR